MANKWRLESAGWGFFGVSCLLFAGPGVWIVWNGTYDTVTVGARIGFGIVLGMIAAAFFTTAANEVLYRLNAGREDEEPEQKRGGKAARGKRGK